MENDTFVVKTCVHGTPALEIENASPELHAFLRSVVMCNYMDDDRYKVSRAAGAFLQGGADLKEGWILIEFWKPKGAQAFVEFVHDRWQHREDLLFRGCAAENPIP